MIDFFYAMTTTWIHILSGFALLGLLFILSYIVSGIYYRYLDMKEETELERMRNAMNNKK